MSLIELTIIIFISLGILDKDKIGKIFRVFNSSTSDQVRKVIGDETTVSDTHLRAHETQ